MAARLLARRNEKGIKVEVEGGREENDVVMASDLINKERSAIFDCYAQP